MGTGWCLLTLRAVFAPLPLPFPHNLLLSCASVSSREIFPYLVVVIGLENVLVLTKSVVSTPVDLEVKLRIAQGGILLWEAAERENGKAGRGGWSNSGL